MKKIAVPIIKLNEADKETTSAPQPNSKKPNTPLDVHEVLDFYKSHAEEISALLRTMKTTDRAKQMFMLGYYIGCAKR